MPQGPGPPQSGPVPLPPAGEQGTPGAVGGSSSPGARPLWWRWGQVGNVRLQIRVRVRPSDGNQAHSQPGGRQARSRWGGRPQDSGGPGATALVARPRRSCHGVQVRPWRSLSLTLGQREGYGSPLRGPGSSQRGGGCPGQLKAPGVDLYASVPPN